MTAERGTQDTGSEAADAGGRTRAGAQAVAQSAEGRLRHLDDVFALAPVGIGVITLDGVTVMSNEALRRMLGYSEEELAALRWHDYTHPDDVPRHAALLDQMGRGEIDHFTTESRFLRKDGRELWAVVTSSVARTPDGEPDYAIGMVQDVTERRHLEGELRQAERHYRLLVERVPAVVYIAGVGAEARWHYVSPQIEEMLGFTPEEWVADPLLWWRQLHPDDRDETVAEEERLVAPGTAGGLHSGTYRMLHRDGRVRWVRDDAIPIRGADGEVTWHGVLVDVTREKELEERLGHQAYHDALTDLPNRLQFHERVEEALGRCNDEGVPAAVLLLDLDRFKDVNDSLGHAYGDQVIVAAARRLRSCLRGEDLAARLGGDEFAVLVEGAEPDQVVALAERVLDALRTTPMRLRDVTVTIDGSIGVAFASPADTTGTLLRNADLAMYRAKRQGGSRIFCYEAGMHEQMLTRLHLEDGLTKAVADDAITVDYQPIVALETGRVVGIEALARWHDAERGDVSPATFIPIAEQVGLIGELGLRVVREASCGLAAWQEATGATAYVSVNVSPLQLVEGFTGEVVRVLAECDLAPECLMVEVTEGVLLVDGARDAVRALRAAGVRVAIDDFGTGYSSLSYLRRLPVDMIKIDQEFLQPMAEGPDDGLLLGALLSLTRVLGLETVCEGVESRDQLLMLRTLGCELVQGYHLARPGPLEEIPAVLDLEAPARATPVRR